MRLAAVELRKNNGRARLVGQVECGSAPQSVEVYFDYPERFESFIALEADAFVPALLVPAMMANETLEIVPPISPRLLFQLSGIRDIWHSWYPQAARIAIQARPGENAPVTPPPRSATFFSGGVDSFYTFLKRLRHDTLPVSLTHLIFMHGAETSLEKSRDIEASQNHVQKIADATGVECIFGETNIRDTFRLHWERYYFGSGLCAIALSLSAGFRYVCIPSSFTYAHQVPHGSTPLVDERFSTEATHIVHDGSEASRAEKVTRILEWERSLVLQNLRVCIYNRGAAFNCHRCYKCVRTAIALKILGAWDDAVTFTDKSTAHWGTVVNADHAVLTQENLELARAVGAERALVDLLDRAVKRQHRMEAVVQFLQNSPMAFLLDAIRYARRVAGIPMRVH